MKSLFPDICTDVLQACKSFYMELLGFNVLFEIDWYIQLVSPIDESIQIAFVDYRHASVPKTHQFKPTGVVITVEVEDADIVYQKAKNLELPMIKSLVSEPWGQRHFMVQDPNGLLVDVYHMVPARTEFLQQYGLVVQNIE